MDKQKMDTEENKRTIEVTEEEERALSEVLRRLSEGKPPTINELIRTKVQKMKVSDKNIFFKTIIAPNQKRKNEE